MATAFRSWVLGGVFEPCSLIVLYVSSEVIVYILKLELYIDRCGREDLEDSHALTFQAACLADNA